MHLPPNDSPMWPILRVLTVAVTLGAGMYFGSEHLDPGEYKTYSSTVGMHALAEFGAFRRRG